MEHPGVKTLLDRIFKQNGGHVNKQSPKSNLDSSEDGLTIIFDEVKKNKPKNNESQSSNAFTNFKENLKQRMKARRQEIRKEEEEDDKMDEEYHATIKENDDPQEDDSDEEVGEDNVDKKAKKIAISDDESEDEDTCGKNEANENSDGDSDNDFQLNLNEDDEESESELVLAKNHKKNKSKDSKKAVDLYEFDDDDTSDDIMPNKNIKSVTSLNGDIPLTNTIPSNQPNSGYDFDSQEYLEGTQFLIDKQQRRSLDEITNISFNCETTQQQQNAHNASSNTINSFKSKASSTTNLTLLNQSDDANDADDFDELAMLCSGQFKQDDTQKKSSPIDVTKLIETENKSKESKSIEINLNNNDLFAADDPDEEEKILKKKSDAVFFDTNSNSNDANTAADSKDKLNNNGDDDNDDDDDEEEEEDKDIGKKSKTKKLVDDKNNDSDAEISSSKDAQSNKINAFDKMKTIEKRTECGDSESESEIDKQGFFEDEAELSGSEAEQDEDDEGESGDDDSIVYSGDESELPGASELQDQLGKIYLKDQMDEDKRQLRLFKEMYLADGETNKKDLRKKQFRWKHLDNNTDNNRFSSEDEVEDEDDEDEDANDTDSRDGSKKNEKYMKLMENRNWRMVRHEREQFVKLKANAETLLSDDELEELEEKKRKKKKQAYDDDSETEYIDENSDDETSRKKSELSNSNSIFKMGQNLLKKKKAPLNKSDQNKRALNGEINAISRLVPKTSNESKSDDPNGDTKHITPGNTENLLKKFSFLNRDKGYLSKLSSYVNKNFTNIDNANAAKTKSRNNTGMVFTKIDLAADDDEETKYSKPAYMNSAAVNSSSVAINEKRVKEDTCEATTSKITITPTPKRAKYDTCESIFNHIN